LDASKTEMRKMAVHFNQVIWNYCNQNQQLLLFNSFEYLTPEDFIYYVLFTAEQLNINPENFPLDLIGSIDIESEYYKIAYKFIRNVSLIDVEDLRWNNYFLRPKTEIILYFFMRIISGQFKGRRISPPKVYQFVPPPICPRGII
jgi:hypothetical protein